MPSARNLYCHEREKRGGSQKSPLMATPLSFCKPTACFTERFEPSGDTSEFDSQSGHGAYDRGTIGPKLQGKPAPFEGEVLIVHLARLPYIMSPS